MDTTRPLTHSPPHKTNHTHTHTHTHTQTHKTYSVNCNHFHSGILQVGRSQWPRSLRRGSLIARLLGLRVRIPPRVWFSVPCVCCVLSGREVSAFGRSHVQRSSTECGVCVYGCDREASIVRRPWPTAGYGDIRGKNNIYRRKYITLVSRNCGLAESRTEEPTVGNSKRCSTSDLQTDPFF